MLDKDFLIKYIDKEDKFMWNTDEIVIKLNMTSCEYGYDNTQIRMNYTLISGTTISCRELLPVRA